MKILLPFVLMFSATTAVFAQDIAVTEAPETDLSVTLCDVADIDQLIGTLNGDWSTRGAASVETQSLSAVNDIEGDASLRDGLLNAQITAMAGGPVQLVQASAIYDVDRVDDMIDTVEADWITDAVSDTACGPEALTQLSAPVTATDRDLNGTVTLLPYFSDRVVMISEFEMRGDFGFATVTVVELMTRE